MKKIWTVFVAVLMSVCLMSLFACDKTEDNNNNQEPVVEPIERAFYIDDDTHPVYCDEEGIFVMEKEADKDFVVINFADIQLDDVSDIAKGGYVESTITEAIEYYKPDLITMSGDQAWGSRTSSCYTALVSFLDGFKTPWAMVFGNHDRENVLFPGVLKSIIESSEYGLFAPGDPDCGYGNYRIDIVEKGTNNIVHSVIMMDSGMYSSDSTKVYDTTLSPDTFPAELNAYKSRYSSKDGGYLISGKYASFPDIQVAWYENTIKDITEKNGGKISETTCVFHMPFFEFYYAYRDYAVADEAGRKALEPIGEMRMHECLGTSAQNSRMFAKMKEMESTKTVIIGHDHINDYSVLYQGIRLTYGVKTGDECYYEKDGSMNGCSAIKIGNDGHAVSEQHYYQYE